MKKEGLLAFVRELDGNDEEDYDNYLRDASMYARGTPNNLLFALLLLYKMYPFQFLVLILSVRGVLVRKFMLAAHALGMTRGEWTFLDVEIFQVTKVTFSHSFLSDLSLFVAMKYLYDTTNNISSTV